MLKFKTQITLFKAKQKRRQTKQAKRHGHRSIHPNQARLPLQKDQQHNKQGLEEEVCHAK